MHDQKGACRPMALQDSTIVWLSCSGGSTCMIHAGVGEGKNEQTQMATDDATTIDGPGP